MGLTTQEQLAKRNVTRDVQNGGGSEAVQNGGGSEAVQLEAIVLQKPSEERMDWKSDAS